ncbi:DUF2726 domain-containing protein [Luteolibacter sp. Populi]|uniref:DUF2726 domain-containing protein n=1 Tax=Luteolibacter sp. Populi TaxID=3230487 RepID=UPI0034656FA4
MKTLVDIVTRNSDLILGCIALIAAAFVLSNLVWIFWRVFTGGPADPPLPRGFPYERCEFLSSAERSFLRALDLALGSRYRIFAKVRMADVIKTLPKLGGRRRYAAFNQIAQKHLDFILCDPATLEIHTVVELDDASHNNSRQRERDKWKDAALRAAKIPLIRIPAARAYTSSDLIDRIAPTPSTPAAV